MTWLKDALTEANGKTFDLKRITAASLLIGFHINQAWAVFVQHSPFDPGGYATAAGVMIASIGASIALGKSGEAPQ